MHEGVGLKAEVKLPQDAERVLLERVGLLEQALHVLLELLDLVQNLQGLGVGVLDNLSNHALGLLVGVPDDLLGLSVPQPVGDQDGEGDGEEARGTSIVIISLYLPFGFLSSSPLEGAPS
jgi:hypothetical protein